jgi:hypothetical protein
MMESKFSKRPPTKAWPPKLTVGEWVKGSLLLLFVGWMVVKGGLELGRDDPGSHGVATVLLLVVVMPLCWAAFRLAEWAIRLEVAVEILTARVSDLEEEVQCFGIVREHRDQLLQRDLGAVIMKKLITALAFAVLAACGGTGTGPTQDYTPVVSATPTPTPAPTPVPPGPTPAPTPGPTPTPAPGPTPAPTPTPTPAPTPEPQRITCSVSINEAARTCSITWDVYPGGYNIIGNLEAYVVGGINDGNRCMYGGVSTYQVRGTATLNAPGCPVVFYMTYRCVGSISVNGSTVTCR